MRKKTVIHMIISVLLLTGHMVHASCWKAKIMGEREASKPKVLIGEGLEAQTFPYPPDPKETKCLIKLLSSDKTTRLTTDIRQTGEQNLEWLLLVNPHGEGPIEETTCTLSWSLGNGFSLTDFNDNVLVADMSQTATYPVSSSVDEYLRFKIKYHKSAFGLSALVRNLQIISGMTPSTWENINCDETIDLADTIALIQQVSK